MTRMTQEEKELLLKDLCLRLPYGVKVENTSFSEPQIQTLFGRVSDDRFVMLETYKSVGGEDYRKVTDNVHYTGYLERIKPYLRPMSSMTEDEKDYIKNVARFKLSDGIHYDDGVHYVPIYQETLDDQWKADGKFPPILDDIYRFMFDYGYTILTDWLLEKHFDFRGLIPKGLALEAPKDMYK